MRLKGIISRTAFSLAVIMVILTVLTSCGGSPENNYGSDLESSLADNSSSLESHNELESENEKEKESEPLSEDNSDADGEDESAYENYKISVLTLENDKNPFTGKALKPSADKEFVVDNSFNSVVCDLGETKEVNRLTLKSTKSIAHINKSLYSVYYSNDNESYTYVKDFSLYRGEKELYFYNLDINARYLKIHSTANSAYDATGNIVNLPESLLCAERTNTPLRASGEFSKSVTVKVENSENKTVYDVVKHFTLKELGVDKSALREDLADIRFVCDGKELPYYMLGEDFYVRILEIGAKKTAEITVMYGNAEALSSSDGEEAFEIVYGTKYSKKDNEAGWDNSVATMPNGDLLRIVDVATESGSGRELAKYRSKDGGLTWSAMERIPNTTVIGQGGAFIVDHKKSTVFYFAFNPQKSPYRCPIYVIQSNDSGNTWSAPKTLSNAPTYALSYSDGIVLSTADGDGPEVDYVLTCAVMTNLSSASFNTSSIYSRDGGKTWTHSNSYVELADADGKGFEGGLSEESVIERKDGTLVLYARCQIDGYDHFAVSCSKDKGITWSVVEADDFSNFYTPNTQPITEFLNGVPIMMWGGNNNLGATSYMRYPLNLAPSYDDAETFVDFVDVSFATIIANFIKASGQGRLLHTNPDLTFCKYAGVDFVYIVSTRHNMYVINAEDFLYKTKGAYDSFESGVVGDGWLAASGKIESTTEGATDGKKAMKINENTVATRSLHYIEEGSVSFSLNASSFGEGFRVELQSAYNDVAGEGISPITLNVSGSGSLSYANSKGFLRDTGLDLKAGDNDISITFNGNEKSARLSVNGKSVAIDYVGEESYISYATVFTNASVAPIIDNFIAIKDA